MPLPTIPSGNVASALPSGYDVDNSIRFNDDDSAKLEKGMSAGNRDRWTFSTWIKRCSFKGVMSVFFAAEVDGSNGTWILFDTVEAIRIGNLVSGSWEGLYKTNRRFRDPSAWMNIVVLWDSGSATAGERIRLWVNGVEETSFETETNPDQNQDSWANQTASTGYFRHGYSAGYSVYGDFYQAETVFIDGTAYTASDFGEFDSDSPNIWIPKDVSGLTFGTNGYYLDYKDSANLGNDANGGTDFTETNLAATDQSTDTPTLNYPTLNPLVCGSYATLSEGNLKLTGNTSSDGGSSYATMAFPKNGKWYLEEKMTDIDGQMPESGIQNDAETSNFQANLNNSSGMPYKTNGSSLNCSGNIMLDGSSAHSISAITSDGAIKQFAIDMDNGAVYYGLNNTWYNSGDPTSGASRTGAIDTWTAGTRLNTWYGTTGYNGSDSETNFGSPTYANSSDAADADGSGQFEFSPPTGYFALNSKNIAEYG